MEDVHCPICVEPMDFTDLATSLCSCNYKVCLWCYKRICEDEGSQARCPNCRQLYDPERLQKQQVDPVQLQDELTRQKSKSAESRRRAASSKPRRELANMRVVQRNLVYAVGLALDICYEETLRGPEFFGQFGKIVKISVSRAGPYGAVSAKNGPTGSAYVTFLRPDDARRCIECTHGTDWEGKAVKACYGTTKYCNAFLKGLVCNNTDCLYLHAEAADADSYTKEQTKSSKFVQLVHEASLQGPAARAAAAAAAAAQAPRTSGAIPIHASGSGSSLSGPLPDALVSALSSSPAGSSVWGSAPGPAHSSVLSAAALVAAPANGGTTWAAVAQTLSTAPSLGHTSAQQQGKPGPPPGPPTIDTACEDWPELPGASSTDALVNADKGIKSLSRNGSSMAAQLAGKPNGTPSQPQQTSSQTLITPSATHSPSTAEAPAVKQGAKLALPNGMAVVDKETSLGAGQRSSLQAPIGSEAVRPGKGGPPPGFGPPVASTPANTPASTPSASGPWSSAASAQSPEATTHSLWSMLGLTTDGPMTTPTAPPGTGGLPSGVSNGWLANGIGGTGRAQSLAEAGAQDLQGHLPIYGSAPSARSPQQAYRGGQQNSNAWEPQEKAPQWQLDQHYKLPAAL
ncbi:hypothetical protein WJX73_000841 [Symbiochloris irregularis]|uniref:CCR4-NOT transcription complex subunit 4 n=1 Tax=Symbiochloris irregularis TaxID=706552 RepID=A0AAW1PPK9_9CHLO